VKIFDRVCAKTVLVRRETGLKTVHPAQFPDLFSITFLESFPGESNRERQSGMPINAGSAIFTESSDSGLLVFVVV